MSFYLSPGVYVVETDLSQRVAAVSTSTGAAVFASKKGPIGPRFITSRQEFLSLYGYPDPSVSFGHDTCLDFLQQSNQLWANRVVNGDSYAGITYYNDDDLGSETFENSAANPRTVTRHFAWTSNMSTASNYETGNRNILTIKLEEDFDVESDITIEFNGGDFTATITTASGTVNQTTEMTALVAAIDAAITAASSEKDQEVTLLTDSISNSRVITIVCPSDMNDLIITNITAESGTLTYTNSARLFEIFAENPGAWASDPNLQNEGIGVKITNVDPGVKQKIRATLSAALVSGDEVTVTVNGTDYSETFTTSNDATLTALAVKIQADTGVDTCEVISVPSGVNNDREFVITSSIAGPDKLTVTGTVDSGGSGTATISFEEQLTGVDADGTFFLEVYLRNNSNIPVESFEVTLADQIDGFGNQLNIAEVINNSAGKSKYIRVYQDDDMKAAALMAQEINNDFTVDSNIRWLTQGADGSSVTSSNIKAGWNQFSNREKIGVRILLGCGYTATDVLQHISTLAFNRRDCIAILDMPSSKQEAVSAFNFRRDELNINSSYAAIYSPDLKIVDEFTDQQRFVPPCGKVGAAYAFTDRVRETWFAPAGLNRGLLRNVVDLRYSYDQGHRDLLNPAQINAIVNKTGKGVVIWGAETLQSKASALQNVNVRRLLIAIEVALVDALDYSVFEPNDANLRFEITQLIRNFLEPIKNGRGLADYKVVSDENNNPPSLRDAGQLNVDVFLTPIIPAKTIRLQTIITKQGATFSELVVS